MMRSPAGSAGLVGLGGGRRRRFLGMIPLFVAAVEQHPANAIERLVFT